MQTALELQEQCLPRALVYAARLQPAGTPLHFLCMPLHVACMHAQRTLCIAGCPQHRARLFPMQDSCVGIDLEWKPEGWAGSERSTRVALMQLGSATTAVLIRVCHLKYRMPQQLRDFLRCGLQLCDGEQWLQGLLPAVLAACRRCRRSRRSRRSNLRTDSVHPFFHHLLAATRS